MHNTYRMGSYAPALARLFLAFSNNLTGVVYLLNCRTVNVTDNLWIKDRRVQSVHMQPHDKLGSLLPVTAKEQPEWTASY